MIGLFGVGTGDQYRSLNALLQVGENETGARSPQPVRGEAGFTGLQAGFEQLKGRILRKAGRTSHRGIICPPGKIGNGARNKPTGFKT